MRMTTHEATTSAKLFPKKRNLRARASDTVRSLKSQVKRLERQREFLSLWKPDTHIGADVEGSYVDVELRASDGVRIHAHKAVLVAKSKAFEAIFRADKNVKVLEVPDMDHEELKAFVNFFYTATVSISVMAERMTSFLRAADKYKVHYLTVLCEDALVANLSRENAITTFDIAKKHCSINAKEAVLKKAIKMGELSTFDEYKLYSQKDPGLLLELYEQLSERIGPLLAKRRRVTPENGTGEHEVNNTCIMYDGVNDKSDTDEDEGEDDQKGDDKEIKQEGEGDATLGGSVALNGLPPFGGGGGAGWWPGAAIQPQHGRPFPAGYDKSMYGPGQRPAFDGSMMPSSPYGVAPPFMPQMYTGGIPRVFMGAVGPGLPSPGERPAGGEELVIQEHKGKKMSEAQAKLEGKRGQNWTNSEVETLIALRGEMHDEFERNKQKQGVNTWSKLHVRMLGMCRGFRKSANACKKKYSILYNEYKKDRESTNSESGSINKNSKKCAYFEQMDMWQLHRPRIKSHADASAGDTTDSPCSSREEEIEIKEEE